MPAVRSQGRPRTEPAASAGGDAVLPNLIVIGAMKSGTTALHRYLDQHPDIAMSKPKELNFFFRPAEQVRTERTWTAGNWQRGLSWYARHFAPGTVVRGESSPGYTSPSHPGVAERMASVVPDARLVYLVRDPIGRALSQYLHHVADGTESRSADQALPDPDSQYVPRSRYYERLAPFLGWFDRGQLFLASHEELLTSRRTTLSALFSFLGVDPDYWSDEFTRHWHTAAQPPPPLRQHTRERLTEALADDADRLRQWAGREFPGWAL